MFEIPLTSDPSQTFTTTLEGQVYGFRVIYNTRYEDLGVWTFTLEQNSQTILAGIPIVLGVDLLQQYPISLKNLYAVNIENKILDATKDNLGSAVKLVLFTDEEIASVSPV